jgi:hypothetical protein
MVESDPGVCRLAATGRPEFRSIRCADQPPRSRDAGMITGRALPIDRAPRPPAARRHRLTGRKR